MSGNYRTDLKPVWCPGCGDYGVLKALTNAFKQLGTPGHQIGIFSGIGCSSRITGYIDAYGFNLLHGRAIPTAEGAKLAKPNLTVLAIGGDGDLFSIGGGHMAHAVRSNIDLTVICMDNFVYGLTKGQLSPTTPVDQVEGFVDNPSPIYPVFSIIGYSVGTRKSFIAQGIGTDIKHLTDLIVRGIQHKGFSYINILVNCITYRNLAFRELKDRCVYLDDSHDSSDFSAALRLAESPVELAPHLGVFFQGEGK